MSDKKQTPQQPPQIIEKKDHQIVPCKDDRRITHDAAPPVRPAPVTSSTVKK